MLTGAATTIYYNCDTADCTLKEWIDTSGGSGDFANLLRDAKQTNVRYLFGLHPDPYMFHQANLRQDVSPSPRSPPPHSPTFLRCHCV